MDFDKWFLDVPNIKSNNISGKLAEFAHLNILSGRSTEQPPTQKGQYYSHQILFKRLFVRNYDECMVFHRAGTGKTITVLLLAEHYRYLWKLLEKNKRPRTITDPVGYKRVVVLSGGKTTEASFKYELVCKLAEDFIDENIRKLPTQKGQKTAISIRVNQYYRFMTYDALSKDLNKMTESDMIEKYNNTLFLCDEAHTLYYDLDKEEVLKVLPIIYKNIHELFKTLNRRKIFLLTATPMHNKPDEILQLLQLIIKEDLPEKLDSMTREERKNLFSRTISFIDKLDTEIILTYMGQEIGDDLITRATFLEMSPHQSDTYHDTFNTKTKDAFSTSLRQCVNFVFPDGSYGDSGFKNYVDSFNDGIYQFNSKMLKALKKNGIGNYSCKFQFIVDLAIKKFTEGKKGYVYNNFKQIGAILIGLCLEYAGYERFSQNTSVFQDKNRSVADYCGQTEAENREIRLDKKKRYALFTPEEGTSQEYIKELYNSPENIHGEYLQVMLFSPVGKESLSLDSTQWIIIDNVWNMADYEQAVNRGIRATSHVRLSQETGEPVEIEIYRLVAVPDGNIDSVDINILTNAENKGVKIKEIEREMKEDAFDCYLEKDRNIRPGIDGSLECEFMDCLYQCSSEPPTPGVNHLGILLSEYSQEYWKYVRAYLNLRFRDSPILSVKEIIDGVNKTVDNPLPPELIMIVLKELSDQKIPFVNRFGFIDYISINGGNVILGDSINKLPYLTNLYGVRVNTIDQLIKENELIDRSVFSKSLTEFKKLFDTWDIYRKAEYLELSISEPKSTPATDYIQNYYSTKIFEFVEPTEKINKTVLQERQSVRQVKNLPTSLAKDKESIVILHTLLSVAKSTGYNIIPNTLNPPFLRLFKDNQWRDPNGAELKVYREMINKEIKERESEIVGKTNSFLLRIVGDDNKIIYYCGPHFHTTVVDLRKVGKGHNLIHDNIYELGPHFLKSGYPIEIPKRISDEEYHNIEDHIRRIKDLVDFDDPDDIKYLYYFLRKYKNNDKIKAINDLIEYMRDPEIHRFIRR